MAKPQPKKTAKPKFQDVPNLPDGKLQHQPSAYDRAYWANRIKPRKNAHLTIRSLADNLGLQYLQANATSTFVYKDQSVRDLQSAVHEIASELPQTEERFLDIADSPQELYPDVDELLLEFGDQIWGGDAKQRAEGNSEKLLYGRLEDRIR